MQMNLKRRRRKPSSLSRRACLGAWLEVVTVAGDGKALRHPRQPGALRGKEDETHGVLELVHWLVGEHLLASGFGGSASTRIQF